MKPRNLGAETCNNEHIKAMLVPYAERSLAKSNREEVDAHLVNCAICRDEVKRLRDMMRPLSELAKSGFKPVYDAHPDHERLFKYAFRDPSLSHSEYRDIDLHVFMCEDCRREISIIEQVSADFDSLVPADSYRWIMPPVLRNLFAPPSRTSAIVENALEKRIPNQERLRAIMQKINLRLVGILTAIVLLIFICLSFITCGDEEGEASAQNVPSPSKAPAVAVNKVKAENWTALPLNNSDPVEACELLSAKNIKYRSVRGRLEVLVDDLSRAQAALQPPADSVSADEALASADYASEVANEAESVGTSQEEEYGSAPSSDYTAEESGPVTTANDVEADKDFVEPEAAPASDFNSAVASPPEPSAPKRQVVPVKQFSQPRVAAPQQRTAVRPVYSAQPRVKAKVASRPVRTYDAASYQPAPAQAAAPVQTVQKTNLGADPTPISASYRHKATSADSARRSLVAPTPQTIHPDIDVTVSSLPRRSHKTEDTSSEITVSSADSSQGGDVIISGNTYDETDSVTSREEIE
ncbi:MAG: hypothetical protein ACI376_06025 [Candidatus Bruticola sp.]